MSRQCPTSICDIHKLTLNLYRQGVLKTISIYEEQAKQLDVSLPKYQQSCLERLTGICQHHEHNGEWAVFCRQIDEFVAKQQTSCFSSRKVIQLELSFKSYLVALTMYYLKICDFSQAERETNAQISHLKKVVGRSEARFKAYEEKINQLIRTVEQQREELASLKQYFAVDQVNWDRVPGSSISKTIGEAKHAHSPCTSHAWLKLAQQGQAFSSKSPVTGLPGFEEMQALEDANAIVDVAKSQIARLEIESPKLAGTKQMV